MGYLRDLEVAAIDMEALKDAMADLKEVAIKSGKVTDADIKEIADDYDLNPKFLSEKFKASFGDGSSMKNVADATNVKTVMSAKSDKKIDELCRWYGVSRARTVEVSYKGKPVTLVCRTRGGSVIGVDHDRGEAYKWNSVAAQKMTERSAPPQSEKED